MKYMHVPNGDVFFVRDIDLFVVIVRDLISVYFCCLAGSRQRDVEEIVKKHPHKVPVSVCVGVCHA